MSTTHCRGFTLLEVLVALAVVVLALGAALSTAHRHTANLAAMRDRTYGYWVASDTLNAWRLGLAETGGNALNGTESMGGMVFDWTLRPISTPGEHVERVEVEVRAQGAEGSVLALETGYRRVKTAPQP